MGETKNRKRNRVDHCQSRVELGSIELDKLISFIEEDFAEIRFSDIV